MRRRRFAVGMVAGVAIVVAVGLTASIGVPDAGAKGGGTPPPTGETRAFTALHRSMRDRVRADGLDGGMVLVARGDQVLDRRSFGAVNGETVMPVASASKWLTTATLMTLVDEGRLTLDDPVADHLPGFGGGKRGVRVRHLLAHTSGLAYDGCVGDPRTTTEVCTARIAAGPDPTSPPGTRFVYSSVGYEVAARLVEVLAGQSFEEAFRTRIAEPLGMTRTRFAVYDGEPARHPVPAASAVSTVDDYERFVGMMAHDGVAGDGRRILSAAAVAEIERDQVAGIDTRDDPAVRTTGIPTYGLGVWRDVVGPDDEVRVLSGSGAYGFYPWIDRRHATYGIVGVADVVHGADHAVPASARQARIAWRAAARLPS